TGTPGLIQENSRTKAARSIGFAHSTSSIHRLATATKSRTATTVCTGRPPAAENRAGNRGSPRVRSKAINTIPSQPFPSGRELKAKTPRFLAGLLLWTLLYAGTWRCRREHSQIHGRICE